MVIAIHTPPALTRWAGPLTARKVLSGDRGYLAADADRLPSGHPFVTVWIVPVHGPTDVLARRATAPLEQAWDRGGDAALFAELEKLYPRLLGMEA